jgi:hypothetical protein
VWRERSLGYDQMHDATPTPTPLDVLSRLTALAFVQAVILVLSVLSGIALSMWQGHSWVDLRFYVADLLLEQSWTLLLFAVGATFLHTILPNRFLGHLAVIGVVPATPLIALGLRNLEARVPMNLVDFGRVQVEDFAGLNGYSPGYSPAGWFWTYWAGFTGLLLIGALLLTRRGREHGWRARMRQARTRWAVRYAVATAMCAAVWLGVGGRIYLRAQPHRPQPGSTLRDTLPDRTRALFFEPAVWNGSVMVDAYGRPEAGALIALLLERGFAVATPALAGGYWALGQKQKGLDALRRDIRDRYGATAPVFLFGHSEGAYRVLASLEQHPNDYRGGVAFCALTPVEFSLPEPALELLVAFDFYYPGLLTTTDATLATIAPWSREVDERTRRAIESSPEKARDLAARFEVDPADLEGTVWFFADIVREFQDMALGNPFDVTTHPFTRMSGVPGFTGKVRRFAADPAALERARSRFSPLTGRLQRPALIVENAYDPILPPGNVAPYVARVASSGFGDNLVVTDVASGQHCNMTLAEEIGAIDRMIAWADRGAKPDAGRFTASPVVEPTFPRLPAGELDGRWRLTDVVNNGRFSPTLSRAVLQRVWTIREGTMTAGLDDGRNTVPLGLAVMDTNTSPRHSDEYDLLGQHWKMIHEVRGDEFIQAYFLNDSRGLVERPRSFVQPGLQVRVFKRADATR